MSEEILHVVQPGAVEAARLAAERGNQERGRVLEALSLELEQARYEADRTQQQYDAVDPHRRLVAGELERRWNDAPPRGKRWNRHRVGALRRSHEIPSYDHEARRDQEWMTLTQAAEYLGVSAKPLRLAVQRGELEADHPLARGAWVFRRHQLDRSDVRQLVQRIKSGRKPPSGQSQGKLNLGIPTT